MRGLSFFKTFVRILVSVCFLTLNSGVADAGSLPGSVPAVPAYSFSQEAILRGLRVGHDFSQWNFVFDHHALNSDRRLPEDIRLYLEHFVTFLSVSPEDIWVNLSPDGHSRIVGERIKSTKTAQILLQQDYELKRLTESVLKPDHPQGQKFWDALFQDLNQHNLSHQGRDLSSLARVWIVPQNVELFERDDFVFIVDAPMRVLMEDDVSFAEDVVVDSSDSSGEAGRLFKKNFKSMILPFLEQEINHGQNFTPLRQIYAAFILAQWFKGRGHPSLHVDSESFPEDLRISDRDIQSVFEQYLSLLEASSADVYEFYDPQLQSVGLKSIVTGGIAEFKGMTITYAARWPASVDFAQLSTVEVQALSEGLPSRTNNFSPQLPEIGADDLNRFVGSVDIDEPALEVLGFMGLADFRETLRRTLRQRWDVVARMDPSDEKFISDRKLSIRLQDRQEGGILWRDDTLFVNLELARHMRSLNFPDAFVPFLLAEQALESRKDVYDATMRAEENIEVLKEMFRKRYASLFQIQIKLGGYSEIFMLFAPQVSWVNDLKQDNFSIRTKKYRLSHSDYFLSRQLRLLTLKMEASRDESRRSELKGIRKATAVDFLSQRLKHPRLIALIEKYFDIDYFQKILSGGYRAFSEREKIKQAELWMFSFLSKEDPNRTSSLINMDLIHDVEEQLFQGAFLWEGGLHDSAPKARREALAALRRAKDHSVWQDADSLRDYYLNVQRSLETWVEDSLRSLGLQQDDYEMFVRVKSLDSILKKAKRYQETGRPDSLTDIFDVLGVTVVVKNLVILSEVAQDFESRVGISSEDGLQGGLILDKENRFIGNRDSDNLYRELQYNLRLPSHVAAEDVLGTFEIKFVTEMGLISQTVTHAFYKKLIIPGEEDEHFSRMMMAVLYWQELMMYSMFLKKDFLLEGESFLGFVKAVNHYGKMFNLSFPERRRQIRSLFLGKNILGQAASGQTFDLENIQKKMRLVYLKKTVLNDQDRKAFSPDDWKVLFSDIDAKIKRYLKDEKHFYALSRLMLRVTERRISDFLRHSEISHEDAFKFYVDVIYWMTFVAHSQDWLSPTYTISSYSNVWVGGPSQEGSEDRYERSSLRADELENFLAEFYWGGRRGLLYRNSASFLKNWVDVLRSEENVHNRFFVSPGAKKTMSFFNYASDSLFERDISEDVGCIFVAIEEFRDSIFMDDILRRAPFLRRIVVAVDDIGHIKEDVIALWRGYGVRVYAIGKLGALADVQRISENVVAVAYDKYDETLGALKDIRDYGANIDTWTKRFLHYLLFDQDIHAARSDADVSFYGRMSRESLLERADEFREKYSAILVSLPRGMENAFWRRGLTTYVNFAVEFLRQFKEEGDGWGADALKGVAEVYDSYRMTLRYYSYFQYLSRMKAPGFLGSIFLEEEIGDRLKKLSGPVHWQNGQKIPQGNIVFSSYMGTLQSFFNFLSLDGAHKDSRFLVAANCYKEASELINQLYGSDKIHKFREQDLPAILEETDMEPYQMVMFDPVANYVRTPQTGLDIPHEDTPAVDVGRVLKILSQKTYDKPFFVLIDITGVGPRFRLGDFIEEEHWPENFHVVVMSSLQKFHQQGLEMTAGGFMEIYSADQKSNQDVHLSISSVRSTLGMKPDLLSLILLEKILDVGAVTRHVDTILDNTESLAQHVDQELRRLLPENQARDILVHSSLLHHPGYGVLPQGYHLPFFFLRQGELDDDFIAIFNEELQKHDLPGLMIRDSYGFTGLSLMWYKYKEKKFVNRISVPPYNAREMQLVKRAFTATLERLYPKQDQDQSFGGIYFGGARHEEDLGGVSTKVDVLFPVIVGVGSFESEFGDMAKLISAGQEL